MIVDVLHPAAVVHVPPRARTQRLTYVSGRTPVEIAAVPDGEMRPVHSLLHAQAGYCLFEHGGHLWQAMSYRPDCYRVENLHPDEWFAWLAGVAHHTVGFELDNTLAMTPLRAYDRSGHSDQQGRTALGNPGEEVDLERLGTVGLDGRETAAREVARFVSEETLVTDTNVYLRYRPAATLDLGSPAIRPVTRPTHVTRPYLSPRHALDDNDVLSWAEPSGTDRAAFERHLRALAPHIEDDVDVGLLGNAMPGWLVRFMDERIRRAHPAGSPGREEAVAARREAAALAISGDLGGLTGAAARDALDIVATLAVRVTGLDPEWDRSSRREPRDRDGRLLSGPDRTWAFLARHVRSVLERNAPAHVPEDEEAMAGIGVSP